jgi:putative transposase
MAKHSGEPNEREFEIAKVLRPLGSAPMSREQAELASRLLGVHYTTVYRLRKRFRTDPVASSVLPKERGPRPGDRLISPKCEEIVQEVLCVWLSKKRSLAHPLRDVTVEIRSRCRRAGVEPASRSTVARRLAAHREAEATALAAQPGALVPPGHLVAVRPLQLVQIDHTQADVFVVDDVTHKTIGRPWLTVAIDIASRCLLAIYLSMERPNAATVALLLTRVALPKAPWLASLGLPDVSWPMHGLPQTLHLDNATEFKGRALRSGCREYGIDLTYRPVGKPHFGGHIERMNRTLMESLRGLPGASGTIAARRTKKQRPPEEMARLTLAEFERWLVLEIHRYHHSEHRGLAGATPVSAWMRLAAAHPIRSLPDDPSRQLHFLIRFLPMTQRTIQKDGLTIFYLRYWHPIFVAWRELGRQVLVRYHPEDLSRVFASVDGKTYVEATFADLRRPPISLWEQRQARRTLRADGHPEISEELVFRTIARQRQIVLQAKAGRSRPSKARRGKALSRQPPWPDRPPTSPAPGPAIDYSKQPEDSDVEIW